jgi:reactive intermediate/imine deaminase
VIDDITRDKALRRFFHLILPLDWNVLLTRSASSRKERSMTDVRSPEIIAPESIHKPMGYSHALKINSGQPLFIAGQVALDASGNLVGGGDFRAQTRQVFENLKAIVESAGGSFSDIVKLNVYVTDRARLPEYREVRDRYVDLERLPASTAVQVVALFRPEFLIEVEAVAALP